VHRLQPPSAEALRATLATEVHRSSELRVIHRLHAVLLVSVGCSCYQVADWFGEDPRSVERWIHAYEQQGLDGLRDQHRAGRQSRLMPEQLRQLRVELGVDPDQAGYAQARWSGKLLAQHLERHYGLELSQRQCQRLLQSLKH
jgi:transposase